MLNFKYYNVLMGSRGSMLISLIGGVFFLVVLSVGSIILLPRYTQIGVGPLTDGEQNTSIITPIDNATSVAIQSDLKSIQIGLEAYFAENGTYPNSLQELESSGYTTQNTNPNKYIYQICDSSGTKIIIYSTTDSNQGIVINQGIVQRTKSKPSCI